jgi:hypothetical protein
MRLLKSWWIVTAAVSVLCGCPFGAAPGGGDASMACGLQGEPCCSGAACGFDLFCQSGICQPEQSDVGTSCTKNLDCQSGICLPITSTQNVCTASCTGASSCVAGWSCDAVPGQPTKVCTCTPSEEVCDGKDNNCNGIVDDTVPTNQQCVQELGTGATCAGGSCTLNACKSTGDCLAGQICDPISHSCVSPDAGLEDGGVDAGGLDGGPENSDAGMFEDAGRFLDAGPEDAGNPPGADAGESDAGRFDAGRFDAGLTDAGAFDAGHMDAGSSDAGESDGGSSTFDAGLLPDAATVGVTVRLTWEEDYGDLDLHYIGPTGTFYESTPYPGDLDWQFSWASAYGSNDLTENCGGNSGLTCDSLNPDWGSNNTVAPDGITSNNPALTLDQRWGYGPEIAFHAQPFAGTYQITVHYFCEADESGLSTATGGPATPKIEVFLNDALQWSTVGPQLVEEQAWNVAQVIVETDGGTSIQVVPLNEAPYTTSEGCFSGLTGVDAGEPLDAGQGEDAGEPADAGESFDAGEPADGGDIGVTCTDASSCQPGEVCPLLYGVCLPACTAGATCANGEACCSSVFTGDVFCPPSGGTCF